MNEHDIHSIITRTKTNWMTYKSLKNFSLHTSWRVKLFQKPILTPKKKTFKKIELKISVVNIGQQQLVAPLHPRSIPFTFHQECCKLSRSSVENSEIEKNYFRMCDVDKNWVIEGSLRTHLKLFDEFVFSFIFSRQPHEKLCNVIRAFNCVHVLKRYVNAFSFVSDLWFKAWTEICATSESEREK